MNNRFASGQRFNADPSEIENVGKNKIKQIIGIVVGIVALVLAFYFGDLQEKTYDPSDEELYNILKWGLAVLGLLELVFSPIVLYDLSRVERNLNQTHITLYDDGIEGVCFNNPSSDSMGASFEVSYADVIGALPASSIAEKGINLRIRTVNKTYSCYAIEQSGNVAKLINEKVAEYVTKADEQEAIPEADSTPFKLGEEIFCVYCGVKLPNEAAFCGACGKKVMEIEE